MAVLVANGLAYYERVKANPGEKTLKHVYYLLRAGQDLAARITKDEPELDRYRQRAELVTTIAPEATGSGLKDLQYLVPEYARAKMGAPIGSIADRVRREYARVAARHVISTTEFAQRVADRLDRPLDEVLLTLRERSILPSGAPPRPRKLLVREVAFSGTKALNGAETPFEFRWQGLRPGLWGIASDANLRGKSTILEVMLWCLRGRPKGLQDAVRAWIREVALGFQIDGDVYRVEFRLKENVPIGVLLRGAPSGGAPIEIARFESEDEFEAVMSDFMMSAFDLSELQSRQKYSHDTLAQTVPVVGSHTAMRYTSPAHCRSCLATKSSADWQADFFKCSLASRTPS